MGDWKSRGLGLVSLGMGVLTVIVTLVLLLNGGYPGRVEIHPEADSAAGPSGTVGLLRESGEQGPRHFDGEAGEPPRVGDDVRAPGVFRLRARNMIDGSGMPALSLIARGSGDTVVLRADGDGCFQLRGGRPWTLSTDDPGTRLLLPDATYSERSESQDVWCYRFVRIRGMVRVERGALAPDGSIVVAARPSTPGASPAMSEEVGTAPWLERWVGRRRLPWKVNVQEGRYELEVPIMRHMMIAASAPGHIPEIRPVDTSETGSNIIDFDLRVGETLRILVTDAEGRPMKGAAVQFVRTYTIPTSELNVEELRLRKRIGGGGFATIGNDATGTTTVAFQATTGTDRFGGAMLSQVVSEGRRTLMVHETGFVPYIEVLEDEGDFFERSISLRRISPAREGYRLRWRGSYASAGSKLQLFEVIEGQNLALRVITADGAGVFPGSEVPPFHAYFAIVTDLEGIGSRLGTLQFGSEETVDISDFE